MICFKHCTCMNVQTFPCVDLTWAHLRPVSAEQDSSLKSQWRCTFSTLSEVQLMQLHDQIFVKYWWELWRSGSQNPSTVDKGISEQVIQKKKFHLQVARELTKSSQEPAHLMHREFFFLANVWMKWNVSSDGSVSLISNCKLLFF